MSVTKPEEDESFDNIHTLLITSTSVMIISCAMEVLMYLLYNNKVKVQYIEAQVFIKYLRIPYLKYIVDNTTQDTLTINSQHDFSVSSKKRDCGRARGG